MAYLNRLHCFYLLVSLISFIINIHTWETSISNLSSTFRIIRHQIIVCYFWSKEIYCIANICTCGTKSIIRRNCWIIVVENRRYTSYVVITARLNCALSIRNNQYLNNVAFFRITRTALFSLTSLKLSVTSLKSFQAVEKFIKILQTNYKVPWKKISFKLKSHWYNFSSWLICLQNIPGFHYFYFLPVFSHLTVLFSKLDNLKCHVPKTVQLQIRITSQF